jgi:hypothetical protein
MVVQNNTEGDVTNNHKETSFTKFWTVYPTQPAISSKNVSLKNTYLDLTPPPAIYDNKQITYSTKYVAVFIPTHVINSYKKLIEAARYNLDSAGSNLDKTQGLASMNETPASIMSSPSFDLCSCC